MLDIFTNILNGQYNKFGTHYLVGWSHWRTLRKGEKYQKELFIGMNNGLVGLRMKARKVQKANQ